MIFCPLLKPQADRGHNSNKASNVVARKKQPNEPITSSDCFDNDHCFTRNHEADIGTLLSFILIPVLEKKSAILIINSNFTLSHRIAQGKSMLRDLVGGQSCSGVGYAVEFVHLVDAAFYASKDGSGDILVALLCR